MKRQKEVFICCFLNGTRRALPVEKLLGGFKIGLLLFGSISRSNVSKGEEAYRDARYGFLQLIIFWMCLGIGYVSMTNTIRGSTVSHVVGDRESLGESVGTNGRGIFRGGARIFDNDGTD